jgi:hypothetical protein
MRRRLSSIIAALVLTGLVGRSAGYLQSLGPAPLRFAPPRPPSKVSLPPLPKADPPEPAPEPAVRKVSDKPAPSHTIPTPPPQPAVTNAVPPSVQPINGLNAGETNTVGSVTNREPVFSTQSFLRFFKGSDNGQVGIEGSLTAPIGFSPAEPPATPSSTATYILSPKP